MTRWVDVGRWPVEAKRRLYANLDEPTRALLDDLSGFVKSFDGSVLLPKEAIDAARRRLQEGDERAK